MTTLWLIDTNVLVYSFDQLSPHHQVSYQLLEHAIAGGFDVLSYRSKFA